MSMLCIIPARGGSKRIPRKNIKDFYGRPMISYPIEAALKSKLFDVVMVSTEDEEIAGIAREYGAAVPFMRSEKTASDTATTAEVLIEVLNQYESGGRRFDYVCCLYPCTPLLDSDVLKRSYDRLIDEGADSIIPLIKYAHPPQRAYAIRENKAVMLEPENLHKRTQDLEPLYHDAGQFYFAKSDLLKKDKILVGGRVASVILSEQDAIDIDNEEDRKRAERLYRLKRGT